MSPALSRSLALECVKLGDALEICNGIMFGTGTHVVRNNVSV